MSKKDTSARPETGAKSGTDWARLEAMTDANIDFTYMPELTAEQLERMRPTEEIIPAFARSGKKRITIRLDNEILSYFKWQAKDKDTSYQTIINGVLRDFVVRNRHEDSLRTLIHEIVEEEMAKADHCVACHLVGRV